jgi:hypothetical protein
MEDVGIFYGCLVYHTAILVFLWPFGIFLLFGIFFLFWNILPRKICQPWFLVNARSELCNFCAVQTSEPPFRLFYNWQQDFFVHPDEKFKVQMLVKKDVLSH